MAIGDITATYEGTFDITSAAFITEMDTLNTGGANATAGAATADILVIPSGNQTNQVHIIKVVRAAA